MQSVNNFITVPLPDCFTNYLTLLLLITYAVSYRFSYLELLNCFLMMDPFLYSHLTHLNLKNKQKLVELYKTALNY